MIVNVFVLNVVRFAFFIIVTIILSGMTTPAVVGVYASYVALVELLSLFNDISLGQQVIQCKQKRERLSEAFFVQIMIFIIILIFSIGVVCLIDSKYKYVLSIMAASKLVAVLFSIHSAKLYIDSKFVEEAWCNLLLTVLAGLFGIAIAFYLGDVLLAFTVLYSVPQLSSFYLSFKFNVKIQPVFSIEALRLFWEDGVSLFVNNGFLRVKIHIERLLFSFFWGVDDLGSITRARTFTETLPSLLYNSVKNVLFTSLVESKLSNSVKKGYVKTYYVVLIISSLFLIGVNIAGEDIVYFLLGNAWGEIVSYIYPVSMLSILGIIYNFEKLYLLSLGKNSLLLKLTIFEVTLMLSVIGAGVFYDVLLTTLLYKLTAVHSLFLFFFVMIYGSRLLGLSLPPLILFLISFWLII